MWWPYKKKKGLFMVSEFVVGVWDGLDECEISLPEIMFQSCPVLHDGCSVMIHSLANKILNVSYFVLMCQYDVWFSYQRDTKTGISNGYFLLKYMSEPILLYFNLSKKSVVSTSTFTRVFLNTSIYTYLSEGCVYFCHLWKLLCCLKGQFI